MDLIFWRHAEAEEEREGLPDMERVLTARGQKQASRMASWLDRQLPDSTRIWASPARRTDQTAHALGRKYRTRAELGPDASPVQLLQVAQWPDSKTAALIVGHQPALGQTIARLLGVEALAIPMKKGSVWWLRQRDRDGEPQTVIVAVQTPDTL